MIKKSVSKILIVLIFIGLNYAGFSAIGRTFAYFSDTIILTDNILQTGVLDMILRSGQGNFVPEAENMLPGDQVNRDIYIGKTTSSLALQHQVSFELIDGDIDLCQQLDLKIWYDHYHGPKDGGYANRDMRLVYDGKLVALSDYSHTDFTIPHSDDQFDSDPSDGTEQWFYYSVIVPADLENSYQNEVCHFQFVFQGWQSTLPDSSQGFTNTETMESVIALSDWASPAIENVESLIATPGEANELKAIIIWETDELATSNLNWGVNTFYGQTAPLMEDTIADKLLHSVEISDLSPQMVYHFHVRSKDAQGNETISPDYVFQTDGSKSETSAAGVVINEFLPIAGNYPEFIEFYNKGDVQLDIADWIIKNNNTTIVIDSDILYDNAISTIIKPGEWLVIDLSKIGEDILDNISDIIILYDSESNEIDTISYVDASMVDKSYARIPDGSSDWVDPIPTPGTPNKLEEEEIKELEPELIPELELEEIIEELPLSVATTTTSTIPDIDILENSTSTSITISGQATSTITEPLVGGAATSATTTTTTEPLVEELDTTTTTTTEPLIEETTTTTTTTPEEPIITTTTIIEETIEEESFVEEIVVVETTVKELINEEPTVIDEQAVVESQPAIEEQSVVMPDNNSSNLDGAGSISDDSVIPAEGIGENSGDSGVDVGGESVSE